MLNTRLPGSARRAEAMLRIVETIEVRCVEVVHLRDGGRTLLAEAAYSPKRLRVPRLVLSWPACLPVRGAGQRK
jgi:hypothetical protein